MSRHRIECPSCGERVWAHDDRFGPCEECTVSIRAMARVRYYGTTEGTWREWERALEEAAVRAADKPVGWAFDP